MTNLSDGINKSCAYMGAAFVNTITKISHSYFKKLITMKLALLVLFISFSSLIYPEKTYNNQSNTTKIICLYLMTSRPDSTSTVTREEITQLAISDSLSEFRSVNRYKYDSLLIKYQNISLNSPEFHAGMNAIDNLPRYRFDGIIIKNTTTRKCLYYGLVEKNLYSYQENDYPLKWQLFPDTTTINGYKCQRASTSLGGRQYTVWFTRQIPISNGPYKFDGLPGLIVRATDKTNSYRFELTRMYKPTKKYHIMTPENIITNQNTAILTSKNKYYTGYFNAKINFIENSINSGKIRFDNKEAVRRNYQEKLKHRNNPIELKY